MKRLFVLGLILISGAVTFSASVAKVRHIKKSTTPAGKAHIQTSKTGVNNVKGRQNAQNSDFSDVPTYFIPHHAAFLILE